MMYTNADQLTPSKINELKQRTIMHRPAIVAVCEVKPKRKVVKNIEEYNISGYSLRHANLDKEYGQGIAVYTRKDLDASILQIECKVDEIVQIDVKLKGGDCLSFSCIYISYSFIVKYKILDLPQSNEDREL